MARVRLLRPIASAASCLVLFSDLRCNISNPQFFCSSTSLAYEATWQACSLLHPLWTSLPSPQLFPQCWRPMVQCLCHLSIRHAASPHLDSNPCHLRFSTGAEVKLSLFKSFSLLEKSPHKHACPSDACPPPLRAFVPDSVTGLLTLSSRHLQLVARHPHCFFLRDVSGPCPALTCPGHLIYMIVYRNESIIMERGNRSSSGQTELKE